MAKILFFGQTRDQLGISQIDWPLASPIQVKALIDQLANQSGKWQFLKESQHLCAVNQTIVPLDHEIDDADEVAIFPPVTGG